MFHRGRVELEGGAQPDQGYQIKVTTMGLPRAVNVHKSKGPKRQKTKLNPQDRSIHFQFPLSCLQLLRASPLFVGYRTYQ
eukprot:scaffold245444_cov20-Tisochrysis_lutea.AAC.2